MKRSLVMLAITAAISTSLVASQEQRAEFERRAAIEVAMQAAGATRAALETRVTRGKPYTADAVTEFVQVLADGNRIVRRTSARLSRDSEGRTRREELTETGAAREKSSVVITDPVAGTSFVLDASTRTAFKAPALFARVQSSAVGGGGSRSIVRVGPASPDTVADGEARTKTEASATFTIADGGGAPATFTFSGAGGVVTSAASRDAQKEELGQQMIDGVMANGTRTTTVIPAGAVGNEQPITVTSEQWFSPELEMLVLTRHSDPRVGETTYRLTNIATSEPDRSLFQVPSDYTVQERRPVGMRRQQ